MIKRTATFQLWVRVIPLQNRFIWDLCTPQCSPIPRGAPDICPALCAHPTHIPGPWAAPLCSTAAAACGAAGKDKDLRAHTRSHAAISICLSPPLLSWNSVEPTLLPNKANKFNYVVMCLSEQAPTRLTGMKHLLYRTLNQNLLQFRTMCVVK